MKYIEIRNRDIKPRQIVQSVVFSGNFSLHDLNKRKEELHKMCEQLPIEQTALRAKFEKIIKTLSDISEVIRKGDA